MELKTAMQLINHQDLKNCRYWLDLGAGDGLFSMALSHFLDPGSRISAVDKAGKEEIVSTADTVIERKRLDFIEEKWPAAAEGIIMANAFHFVKEQQAFLARVWEYLPETGLFLLIEYDSDRPNSWVPYPLSLPKARDLAQKAGFRKITELGRARSTYQANGIYSLLIYK